ncbi:Transmembrane transcriptional regulator (anti-sigma factor RsiW) [Polaromonas sp. OV174]|uniref:anti-sigma factor family protein n=1 Tax=Polaromonas sp. OV174 TaxID=1855300 RepID=UPI0008EC3B9C|nr:anti-sigma factor [Polaromonas sp. OV174]SFC49310.1 Transmembrane transcriptional regulator (anti-sigma factor RsiW) [Polaromonas sp. OV174]
MDEIKSLASAAAAPITEADLHAYVDQQLTAARRLEIEHFLASRPDERQRVLAWQRQNELLRAWLDPVVREPLPLRLPLKPEATPWPWGSLAAGIVIAAVSAGSAWFARGAMDSGEARLAAASPGMSAGALVSSASLPGFAQRAAIAHLVYSPDLRRPVEVGADQEQALVAWLSKRLGTPVHPPSLSALGYELVGGRLLPGGKGAVAQFMYSTASGQRLTLYVTREAAGQETAFKFGQDGAVNVFYWVDKNFGYALSGGVDRKELARVGQEVYRQLEPTL